MIFAIIGTRQPDNNQLQAARELSRRLTAAGHLVRTGGAYGIDQAAMEGADVAKLEVYLPWGLYNAEIIPRDCKKVIFSRGKHTTWTESVGKYHPNPTALTKGAFALHARNFGIVSGENGGSSRCAGVIAFPNQTGGGGTAQGIRVATGENVRVRSAWKNTLTLPDQFVKEVLDYFNVEKI